MRHRIGPGRIRILARQARTSDNGRMNAIRLFDDLPGQRHPRNLTEMAMPSTLRVLVLAPHPDDFDAIAVTLHGLHQKGTRIDVAVLSGSASGVEDGYQGAFTAADKAALREAEQRESCRLFGLPDDRLLFLRLVEDEAGDPRADAANLARVHAHVTAVRPDVVFLPHKNDTNPGHQRAFGFFRQIVRSANLEVVGLLNRDPKTIAMRDDLYQPFGEDVAAWKGRLLRCHQSQHQRNLNTRGHGFDVRVLECNRRIAAALHLDSPYAEAFEVWRPAD